MPSRLISKDSMPSPGVRRRPGKKEPGWQPPPSPPPTRRHQSACAFNDRRGSHPTIGSLHTYTFRVTARERERQRKSVETNEISDSLCCAGVAAGARRRFLFITIQFFFSQVRTAHNTSGTHAYTQTVIIPVAILCRARLNK